MQYRSRILLCFFIVTVISRFSYEDVGFNRNKTVTPLPFPPCPAYAVDCLRKGLRTFFFLMDSQHFGMKSVDPVVLSSVTVSFPNEQLDFRLRRVNVTGARWTKLINRRFNLPGERSGVTFLSDLHVTADILLNIADRFEPCWAQITMDIQNIETNITYSWFGERRIDTEDYILIGHERLAVRNERTPTYFLQPVTEEAYLIDKALQSQPAVLDHLANEITISVMHLVLDNFRLFAEKVPVKFYYKYT